MDTSVSHSRLHDGVLACGTVRNWLSQDLTVVCWRCMRLLLHVMQLAEQFIDKSCRCGVVQSSVL